ncbi:MAG TPA: radical SAM protein [Chitinophagales bacterium]|nr:radical SAM protein [Chitinophagales bacterium]
MAAKSLSFHASVPSLGLAYIAGAIKAAGYNVYSIDAVGEDVQNYRIYKKNTKLLLHGLNVAEIVQRIKPGTDVVGINNIFLHEYHLLKDLCNAIKAKHSGIKVIVGGENATSLWQQELNDIAGIDFIVMGEGETKITDLLFALENNLDADKVEGIAFLKDGKPYKTAKRERLKTLEGLPRPAWDVFPLEVYMDAGLNSGVNRGRSIPMLTSRGCPYQCKFCSAPEMWTTRYVTREPVDVVNEMEEYVKKYKIVNVDFQDLTSFITKKWIKEFCELKEARGLGYITWQIPQGSRSEVIDNESAELLYRSGCCNYTFAPESGSERLIAMMKKKLKVDHVVEAMMIAKRHKMNVDANIIIGTPDEEWYDLWLTYKMIIRFAAAGIDGIGVMPFGPYPGSEYYHLLSENGMLNFNEEYVYSSLLRASTSIKSYNVRFKPWQIIFVQYMFLFTFYGLLYLLRPWHFIHSVSNAMHDREENIMDQFLTTKFKQLRKWARLRRSETAFSD